MSWTLSIWKLQKISKYHIFFPWKNFDFFCFCFLPFFFYRQIKELSKILPDCILLIFINSLNHWNSLIMGRKNKSSKAAEKKRDRLALERRMNDRIKIVKAANDLPDPLEQLPSFKVENIYNEFES